MRLFHRKSTAEKKKQITLETFDGDVLLSEQKDRRILPDVPDPSGQRSAFDRRGAVDEKDDITAIMRKRKSGIRYKSKFPITVLFLDEEGKEAFDHRRKPGHFRYRRADPGESGGSSPAGKGKKDPAPV